MLTEMTQLELGKLLLFFFFFFFLMYVLLVIEVLFKEFLQL